MIQPAAFRVLACFYDVDERTFVELCEQAGYPTDLGGYYIRQLVAGGYVSKVDRGVYAISPKGKQQMAFYYGKQLFAPRPRFAVLLVAKQAGRYIVLQRAVQPFLGTTEWLAGVVHMGEPMSEAVARVLKNRLGCKGDFQSVGLFRRTDFFEDAVFDDKLFAVHTVEIAADAIIPTKFEMGDIALLDEAELASVAKPAKSLLDILHYCQNESRAPFEERRYEIHAADLSL
jgi:ADP-ribose pyrophosphatase YjhB (NUDIX family)